MQHAKLDIHLENGVHLDADDGELSSSVGQGA